MSIIFLSTRCRCRYRCQCRGLKFNYPCFLSSFRRSKIWGRVELYAFDCVTAIYKNTHYSELQQPKQHSNFGSTNFSTKAIGIGIVPKFELPKTLAVSALQLQLPKFKLCSVQTSACRYLNGHCRQMHRILRSYLFLRKKVFHKKMKKISRVKY